MWPTRLVCYLLERQEGRDCAQVHSILLISIYGPGRVQCTKLAQWLVAFHSSNIVSTRDQQAQEGDHASLSLVTSIIASLLVGKPD